MPDDPWFRRAQDLGYFAANQWPGRPARFREIWEAYYREMSSLAFELMQLFAVALGLDKHWFDDKVDRPISNLFANHYPPLTAIPEPGQLRVGEHNDYGSLTLLSALSPPPRLWSHLEAPCTCPAPARPST